MANKEGKKWDNHAESVNFLALRAHEAEREKTPRPLFIEFVDPNSEETISTQILEDGVGEIKYPFDKVPQLKDYQTKGEVVFEESKYDSWGTYKLRHSYIPQPPQDFASRLARKFKKSEGEPERHTITDEITNDLAPSYYVLEKRLRKSTVTLYDGKDPLVKIKWQQLPTDDDIADEPLQGKEFWIPKT